MYNYWYSIDTLTSAMCSARMSREGYAGRGAGKPWPRTHPKYSNGSRMGAKYPFELFHRYCVEQVQCPFRSHKNFFGDELLAGYVIYIRTEIDSDRFSFEDA